MLIAYGKELNGQVQIYEKGETYIGMEKRKVNRMFKDYNGDPLTFPNVPEGVRAALHWCIARNEIMRTSFI